MMTRNWSELCTKTIKGNVFRDTVYDTVFQDKEPIIQIMHVNGNYWACAATIAKGKKINVYNSSFVSWDQHIIQSPLITVLVQHMQY